MQYRREIDGLRTVAVLPVVFFHAGIAGFAGGYVGVDVFFVISGYLITAIIVEETKNERFSLARFYERRARRILPALFLVLICCMPFAWWWMLPYQLVDFSNSVVAVSLFSSNFLFWQEIGYFGAAAGQKPLLHTWSLAIEEQYYVLFPLYVMLLWRFGKNWLLWTLVVVGGCSLALSEWAWRHYSGANFFLIPTRGWELLVGSLITLWKLDRVDDQPHWINQVASLLGFALIAYSVVAFSEDTPEPSLYTLLPTLGAALIIIYATPETRMGRLLGSRVFVAVGLISYSVYLWHQPLFAFARIKSGAEPGVTMFLLLILATFPLSYATWRFVEQPFRDKQYVSRRTILLVAPAVAVLFIGMGMVFRLDHGFISRFPVNDRDLISFNPVSMGRYVAARFESLKLKPFAEGKRKILVVGDSFAQDFINAAAENGYLQNASISTHEIGSECGALISKADFTINVTPGDRASCASQGRFESAEVLDRIRQADVVLLVAKWMPWQARYVNETVEALKMLGAKRVIVVGRKSFGVIAPLNYLGLSPEQKSRVRNTVDPEQRAANQIMANTIPDDEYVNTQALLCGNDSDCPVFTDDQQLISFDGNHLMPAGALWAGRRLFASKLLAPLR